MSQTQPPAMLKSVWFLFGYLDYCSHSFPPALFQLGASPAYPPPPPASVCFLCLSGCFLLKLTRGRESLVPSDTKNGKMGFWDSDLGCFQEPLFVGEVLVAQAEGSNELTRSSIAEP